MSLRYSEVMCKGLWATFLIYFVVFEKKVFNFFFCSKLPKSLINSLTFKLKKSKIQLFFDFFKLLQNARKWSQMASEAFPGLETLCFHPKTPPLLLRKQFFKTDFGALRSCFCLYGLLISEGLKIEHFRGLQLEFFRLNREFPERVRWVWDSLRSCQKDLWATFLIYFVVFEKKVFNFFFCSKLSKSLINSLTFQLQKSKIQLFFVFFKLLQNVRKCSQMASEAFPGLETLCFHPKTPPLLLGKKVSEPILEPWEAVFAYMGFWRLENRAFSRPTTRIF